MSQPCPYCGSSVFEEENGVIVCTTCGRQQEGGLQVADDDADFGTQGKVVRRKVEKTKVKVTKIYRGARAYRTYLQAWQHILWRQSYTLIHGAAKAPPELWTVCRDLWTLKLSSLLKRFEDSTREIVEENVTTTEPDASSQSNDEQIQEARKTHEPKLWDTISLIYLAAILVRCPISLSKIYSLIRSEDIPFIRAIRFVPYEISSHLPSEYQLALDTTSIPQCHELQESTFKFIEKFTTSFDMQVPALNWKILLYEWIFQLGLPLQTYETAKGLANILKYDFTYQFPLERTQPARSQNRTRRPRRSPVAMPELQLMSLIIVAIKLLFPFPIPEPPKSTPQQEDNTRHRTSHLILDWTTWLSLHKAHSPPPEGPAKHIETTDKDVLNMSSEELDKYVAWYQNTFVTPDDIIRKKRTDLEMNILDMFPLKEQANTAPSDQHEREEAPSSAVPAIATGSDRHHQVPAESSRQPDASDQMPQTNISLHMQEAQSLCAQIHSHAIQYTSTPRLASYPIISTIDDLKTTTVLFTNENKDPTAVSKRTTRRDSEEEEEAAAKTSNPILYFHSLAAELACTDLDSMFRALRYTEGRMEKWIRGRREREIFGEEGDQLEDEV